MKDISKREALFYTTVFGGIGFMVTILGYCLLRFTGYFFGLAFSNSNLSIYAAAFAVLVFSFVVMGLAMMYVLANLQKELLEVRADDDEIL